MPFARIPRMQDRRRRSCGVSPATRTPSPALTAALLREGVPDHWAVSLFVLVGTPVAAAVLLVTPSAIGR